MKSKAKIIFHIDFNAFFCSVAEIYNPLLRDTCFAIGNDRSNYGVISTCSYAARKYGIKSGMPQIKALELLPSLKIVSLPYEAYLYYHYRFIDLLKEYTNIIEVASIDEAYIDITDCKINKHPFIIAKEIQTRLLEKYSLSCSIGIAPTKFLAKMASDLKKPLGITILRKRDIEDKLYNLSVKDIYGIGNKTSKRLIENNIFTIRDFIFKKEVVIKIISKEHYDEFINSLKGNSSNILITENHDPKSISRVRTYDSRLYIKDEIISEFYKIFKELYDKLINIKKKCCNITITLRNLNFKTITRTQKVELTDDYYRLKTTLDDLIDKYVDDEGYRLIGITFNNLEAKVEDKIYNLFNIEDNPKVKMREVVDSINKKYKSKVIDFAKEKD